MAVKKKKRRAKKKPLPEIRNLQETADFFGVTTPTVQGWIRDGCPVEEGGHQGVAYKLDLRRVADWRKGREDDQAKAAEERAGRDAQLKLELLGGDAMADEGDGPMTPKQRADFLRSELDRVKLAEKRGELVHADMVRDMLSDAFALVRERLRGVPDQLARSLDLADEDASKALALVDDILNDLADALGSGEAGEENAKAA